MLAPSASSSTPAGPAPVRLAPGRVKVAPSTPFAATSTLGRSPACGPCGWVAAADAVDVNAVDPVRQAGRLDPEADAAGGLPCPDAADRLAGSVDQRHRCPTL